MIKHINSTEIIKLLIKVTNKAISIKKKLYDELTDMKKRNEKSRGGYDSYSDVINRILIEYNKKNVKSEEI